MRQGLHGQGWTEGMLILADGPERVGMADGMVQIAIKKDVASVGPPGDGSEAESGGELGGEIFEAMDGEVGVVAQQRFLDFLGEEPLGQLGRSEGRGLHFVAGGFDDPEFEAPVGEGRAALGENEVRLGEGQGAAAGGDANRGGGGHGGVGRGGGLARPGAGH